MHRQLVASVSLLFLVVASAGCGGGGDTDAVAGGGETTVVTDTADAATGSDTTAGSDTIDASACTYTDAGNGSVVETSVGAVLIDSLGATYDVTEGCELVFVECRYEDGRGETFRGQPATTFTDSGGASLRFGENCVVEAESIADAISAELVDLCASLEGALTKAISDGEWSCSDIPLGDARERNAEVDESFASFCAYPSIRSSGILSAEAPWFMGVSCSPARDFVSEEIAAACDSVDGTIVDALGDDNWTCADVPLGDTTDRYGEVEAVLAPFCAAPAQFTSGLMSTEAPWFAGWTCTPA